MSALHAVLHDVASAQMKPPAHAALTPAAHEPARHVEACVSIEPVQDAGAHVVDEEGKTHAPDVSQPVAPQVLPTGEHAAAQQLPVPETPQTPLVHWASPEQTAPLPSRLAASPAASVAASGWTSAAESATASIPLSTVAESRPPLSTVDESPPASVVESGPGPSVVGPSPVVPSVPPSSRPASSCGILLRSNSIASSHPLIAVTAAAVATATRRPHLIVRFVFMSFSQVPRTAP